MKINFLNKKEGRIRAKAAASAALALLVLFALFALSPVGRENLRAWADGLTTPIDGIEKSEVFRSDTSSSVTVERKANVLFYLDTSMLMNCTGTSTPPMVVP